MKEITIKIKPKLKWETHKYFCYGYEFSKYNKDIPAFPIFKIKLLGGFHELSRYHAIKTIGTFKTLKTAKSVAELLYQG